MPNWCSTSVKVIGNKKEIGKLYNVMYKLQNMAEPAVKNGFGSAWLGCLVEALDSQLASENEDAFCYLHEIDIV
jgi:hypothetical protein